MVEEFPSNSHNQREAKVRPASSEGVPKDGKSIKRITEGEVIRRKQPLTKRFKGIFFGGSAREAIGFVGMDVLVPAARDMISHSLTELIETMIFGQNRRPRTFRPEPYRTNYNGLSRPGNSYGAPAWRNDPRRDMSPRSREVHNFDEIMLESRGEAEQVIDTLYEIVREYNQATVSDLYQLVGITSAYTDQKYGWTDLRGANVQHVRGAYLLNLPKPVPLD